MRYRLLSAFIVLPLFACSGNPLLSSSQEQFLVDSAPVGASILILGETVGQTPLTLQKHDVFPQSFDPEKKHLYGRIELVYPGCEPFITTISSRVINEGLTALLTCHDNKRAEPASTPTQVPIQEQPQGQVQQPATDGSHPVVPATATPDLKQRLQQLKGLFDEGLISEEDYNIKRRELLRAL
jgi:hypothetical protein